MKRHRGAVALHLSLSLLIGVMLIATAMIVYEIYFAIHVSQEKTNEAVLAVAAYNVSVFYGGAREGDGQARVAANEDFSAIVTTDDVVTQLCNTLPGTLVGGTIVRQNDAFMLSDIETIFLNYADGNLNFTTTYTLQVPIYLLGLNTTVDLPMTTHSSYAPKF